MQAATNTMLCSSVSLNNPKKKTPQKILRLYATFCCKVPCSILSLPVGQLQLSWLELPKAKIKQNTRVLHRRWAEQFIGKDERSSTAKKNFKEVAQSPQSG